MLSLIFVFFVFIFFFYILFNASQKYELLLLIPFFFSTNFFGFLPEDYLNFKGVILNDDIVLVVLVLISIYFLTKKEVLAEHTKLYYRYRRYFIILLLFFLLVVIISIFEYHQPIPTIIYSRNFFRYIEFFFYLVCVFRIGRDRFANLFNYIEKITLILSVIYVINFGFNIDIFLVSSYQQFAIGRTEVSRNFAAFPLFAFFTVSRLIIVDRNKIYLILGLVLILFTAFLTSTRTFLLIYIFAISVSFVIKYKIEGKRLRFIRVLRVAIILTVLIVPSFILFRALFPQQLRYFSARIEQATSANSIEEMGSVYARYLIIATRVIKVWEVNPITGLGILHPVLNTIDFYPDLYERPYAHDPPGTIIIGDQSWGSYVGSVGFLGVYLYLCLFFVPVIFLIKNKLFFKLDILFYPVLVHLFIEIFVRAFISRNLFTNVILITFYFATVLYFIELYLIENKLEKINSRK